MTNPGTIVRVRARNGGRASVYEANGWAQAYSAGLLEGNGVTQNTVADMNVLVGGSATKPDVVLATNPAGYKIALDLVGQQAIAITAPASNKRISSIVAYTDDLSLATTEDTVTGSPASCGLIVVNGTAASTPVAPNDTQIRSAITADGATGSQAAYCVIAEITVASGTTAITDNEVETKIASITSQNIDFSTFGSNYSTAEKNTMYAWINGKNIYKKTVNFGALPNATTKIVSHNISNLDTIIKIEGYAYESSSTNTLPLPYVADTTSAGVKLLVSSSSISIWAGVNRSTFNAYITIYYTKSSQRNRLL